jgi:hypothetical protein
MKASFDKLLKEILPHQHKLKTFYEVKDKTFEVLFHFPSIYAIWEAETKPINPPRRQQFLKDVESKGYFVSRRNLNRLHGKPARCLVLNYRNSPSKELLSFVFNAVDGDACVCDIATLVARGCQCGGV